MRVAINIINHFFFFFFFSVSVSFFSQILCVNNFYSVFYSCLWGFFWDKLSRWALQTAHSDINIKKYVELCDIMLSIIFFCVVFIPFLQKKRIIEIDWIFMFYTYEYGGRENPVLIIVTSNRGQGLFLIKCWFFFEKEQNNFCFILTATYWKFGLFFFCRLGRSDNKLCFYHHIVVHMLSETMRS